MNFTAKLNVIAPLISNCYLASYALVNFSTFHIDLIQPVGWRPKFQVRGRNSIKNYSISLIFFSFQYYNKWLSLLGCALSVTAMFLCSWPTALITFAVVFALFLVVKYRKPGNSPNDRSKFTASTCRFQCRGQLGFVSSSSSLQNGSDYRPAIEHDGGSRQNLHSADPRHDRITQHAADFGGFRLFAVQEQLAHDLRTRHQSKNLVHNFHADDVFLKKKN